MISVVMPAHNEEALVGRAIDSVLSGTTLEHEVIVVLDRCADRTAEVVAGYGGKRVRAIQNEGPPGLGGALNSGLASATGDWVARLDADDIQHPGRLERQLELAERDSLDVCCGWARMVDAAGRDLLIQSTPAASDAIRRALRRSNVIVHSSVLMRRSRVLAEGGYRKTRWEDYDLWVRLSAAGCRFGCLEEVVVTREFRPEGYGATFGRGLGGRLDVARLQLRAALALWGWGGGS